MSRQSNCYICALHRTCVCAIKSNDRKQNVQNKQNYVWVSHQKVLKCQSLLAKSCTHNSSALLWRLDTSVKMSNYDIHTLKSFYPENGFSARVWSHHTGPPQWPPSTEEKEEKKTDEGVQPLSTACTLQEKNPLACLSSSSPNHPVHCWADEQHTWYGGEKELPPYVRPVPCQPTTEERYRFTANTWTSFELSVFTLDTIWNALLFKENDRLHLANLDKERTEELLRAIQRKSVTLDTLRYNPLPPGSSPPPPSTGETKVKCTQTQAHNSSILMKL